MSGIPAVIIDLDGTLVANQSRMAALYQLADHSGINWDKWNEESRFDPHAEWCLELVIAMSQTGHHILFITGRSGTVTTEAITREWLAKHVPANIAWSLIMRTPGDERDDFVAKQEIYWQKIAPSYSILFAVDDKQSNIDMWRSLGITALQCANY